MIGLMSYEQLFSGILFLDFLRRMALQNEISRPTPSAQLVGNAFIEQYYHILHNNPGLVHRFYQESSVLSRPDSNGVMTSVTTMQGINEKILSLNYNEYKAEIKTADAQKSYEDGVTVLVTGCLTGKDNLKRKFAQSFFLAPQDNGFFVLNDVFRFVEDGDLFENHSVNEVNDAATILSSQDPGNHILHFLFFFVTLVLVLQQELVYTSYYLFAEPTHVPDPPAPDLETTQVEENPIIVEKTYDTSDHEGQYATESDVEPPSYSNGNDVTVTVELASMTAQEDSSKKSYASIVKVPKGSPGPSKVYVPTNTVRVTSKKAETNLPGPTAPASVPEASAPTSTSALESSDTNEEVEGYSIYIRNLPLNVTTDQLQEEFKKFGPIKQGGVQVRNKKLQGYCFGFVEFESSSSMNSAIQASPITIGGRQAVIEIKRTTTRVGSSERGRFPPAGRGGFRNDSFRGRGNYGGGRSFGRNEYVRRGEFSGRGRGGPAGRSGYGYQARGRGGRSKDEWRKRKELQSLRRMEAKRKRSEKQLRNLKVPRDRSRENGGDEEKTGEVANGVHRREQFVKVVDQFRAMGMPNCPPPPATSQGSGSTGVSESESQAAATSRGVHTEARSHVDSQSSPKIEDELLATPRMISAQRSGQFNGVQMEINCNKPPVPENGANEIVRNVLENMPCVSTTGDGPDRKRIEGFLYRYKKGEEVRILCVCHGSFLSPAEFVKHAGGGDVAHPLKHIVVNPSPFL
ncbi:ras GTPase-activating protein-binding protein 2-like [Pyrus ussuriensis x Pyrus communis]|uniref:Ras GTPase-activating protein-binding protein 2-like n=1 Tax=Pyrus ussuriensis x Pyrus communis TaxID=2448454 RepID=A0A5N5G4Q5_9ROSA|nr:ras GTPase-activating protein-binding protein 2-like [Pyrus ussuriensis x Pyrus communis]